MPTPAANRQQSTVAQQTQLNNLRAQWYRMVQDAKQFLQRQANQLAPGAMPAQIVSNEAAVNRALSTGGQALLNQINQLQGQLGGGRTAIAVTSGGRPSANGPLVQGGGPRTPASASPSILTDLSQQYQDALNAANQANEQRYQDTLAGYQDLIGNITGRLQDRESQFNESVQGLGESNRSDINRQFDLLGAKAHQDLITRGVTGSTINPSVQTGIEEARARALANADAETQRVLLSQQSQLSGDTANSLAQLGGNLLNFQERRSDVAPDFSSLAQLAAQFGLGNAGQGFVPQGGQPGFGGGGGQSFSTQPIVTGVPAQYGVPGALNVNGSQFNDLGQQLVGGAIGAINAGLAPFFGVQGGGQSFQGAQAINPLVGAMFGFNPLGNQFQQFEEQQTPVVGATLLKGGTSALPASAAAPGSTPYTFPRASQPAAPSRPGPYDALASTAQQFGLPTPTSPIEAATVQRLASAQQSGVYTPEQMSRLQQSALTPFGRGGFNSVASAHPSLMLRRK